MKGTPNFLGCPLRCLYYIVARHDASTETFRIPHVVLPSIADRQSRVPAEGVVGDVGQAMAFEREVEQGLSNGLARDNDVVLRVEIIHPLHDNQHLPDGVRECFSLCVG